MTRRIGVGLFLAALLGGAGVFAAEQFELKPESIHCPSPDPLKTGHIYPFSLSGCDIVHTSWSLIGKPKRIDLGIMQVNMGKSVGMRYVNAFAIVKAGENPPTGKGTH
jgi:hypothetical protein